MLSAYDSVQAPSARRNRPTVQVIGVVIGQQKRLAQNRLAISWGIAAHRSVFEFFTSLNHFLEIMLERLHALATRFISGGTGVFASSPPEIRGDVLWDCG